MTRWECVLCSFRLSPSHAAGPPGVPPTHGQVACCAALPWCLLQRLSALPSLSFRPAGCFPYTSAPWGLDTASCRRVRDGPVLPVCGPPDAGACHLPWLHLLRPVVPQHLPWRIWRCGHRYRHRWPWAEHAWVQMKAVAPLGCALCTIQLTQGPAMLARVHARVAGPQWRAPCKPEGAARRVPLRNPLLLPTHPSRLPNPGCRRLRCHVRRHDVSWQAAASVMHHRVALLLSLGGSVSPMGPAGLAMLAAGATHCMAGNSVPRASQQQWCMQLVL
jgi:hypothetical protein